MFDANLTARTKYGTASAPSFVQQADGLYTGVVAGSVQTSILAMINIFSLPVAARAGAVASDPDNSCILTLNHGQPASHISLTLNGAPIVNLSGCSIRSNTSLNCNGHDGNVTKGIASGSSSDCGQPKSNAAVVPDVYAPLAGNITKQCGQRAWGDLDSRAGAERRRRGRDDQQWPHRVSHLRRPQSHWNRQLHACGRHRHCHRERQPQRHQQRRGIDRQNRRRADRR